jgi:phosphoribosylformylglycinamidine synthase subunit PurS
VRATILVRPKPGILDPQGQAVQDSLRKLGFSVAEAHVGRLVELELEEADEGEARELVDRMCRELLANPLIETFEIELGEGD